ncbi:hypothetical protein L7F22_059507, partial [Adiantum nelumboides]|nr:hypothetical protein [Adiantum nelumboides]
FGCTHYHFVKLIVLCFQCRHRVTAVGVRARIATPSLQQIHVLAQELFCGAERLCSLLGCIES